MPVRTCVEPRSTPAQTFHFRPAEGGQYVWKADITGLLREGRRHDDPLFDEGQWDAVEHLTVPTLLLRADLPPCLMKVLGRSFIFRAIFHRNFVNEKPPCRCTRQGRPLSVLSSAARQWSLAT